jgi:hypothetical protein
VLDRQKQLLRALLEEMGATDVADNEADVDEACTQDQLRAGVCTDRIGLGTHASQKVPTPVRRNAEGKRLQTDAVQRNDGAQSARLLALRCRGRQALQQLFLHIARPGPADQRTQRGATGHVALDLKRHGEIASRTR